MAENEHETLYTEQQARQIEQGVVSILKQQTGLDFTAVCRGLAYCGPEQVLDSLSITMSEVAGAYCLFN